MVKVSVIIPVYGVENYIERCARSLMEQTLDEMEFIFVNDCTKDSSIVILERVLNDYQSRKNCVKIVHHQNNKGLPQARKTGLLHATGEFIAHCDSDDWVDCNLYEKLYHSAVSYNSDIAVCDFCVHRTDAMDMRIGTRTNDINAYRLNLLFQKDPVSMWNKLVRREIYSEDIIFPSDNMGEDMATTLQLVAYCSIVSYVEDAYYHYDGTTTSITRGASKDAVLTRALQACRNVSLAIRLYKDSENDRIRNGITHLKFMQRRQLMPIINHKDAYDVWVHTFPEINKDVLFKRDVAIGIWDRIKFCLTLIGVFPLIKEYFRSNLN